jgi:hypothetical protein
LISIVSTVGGANFSDKTELSIAFRSNPRARKIIWSEDSTLVLILCCRGLNIAVYSPQKGLINTIAAKDLFSNLLGTGSKSHKSVSSSNGIKCIDIVSMRCPQSEQHSNSESFEKSSFLVVYSDSSIAYVNLSPLGNLSKADQQIFVLNNAKGMVSNRRKPLRVEAVTFIQQSNVLIMATNSSSGKTDMIDVFLFRLPSIATLPSSLSSSNKQAPMLALQEISIARGAPIEASINTVQKCNRNLNGIVAFFSAGLLGQQSMDLDISISIMQLAVSPDEKILIILFSDGYISILGLSSDDADSVSLNILRERFVPSNLVENHNQEVELLTTAHGTTTTQVDDSTSLLARDSSNNISRMSSIHFVRANSFMTVSVQGIVQLFDIMMKKDENSSFKEVELPQLDDGRGIFVVHSYIDALPPSLGPCATHSILLQTPLSNLKISIPNSDYDNIRNKANMITNPEDNNTTVTAQVVFLRAIDTSTSQTFHMTSITTQQAIESKIAEGLFESATELAIRSGRGIDFILKGEYQHLLNLGSTMDNQGVAHVLKLGIKKGIEDSSEVYHHRIIDVFRKIDDDEWVIATALSYPNDISGVIDRNSNNGSRDGSIRSSMDLTLCGLVLQEALRRTNTAILR